MPTQVGAELLAPRIAAARQRLEVERAAEGLARAAAGCRAVADLPRLEAAILTARKVGAHELDPGSYRAASELRSRLDGATRARSALDAALRTLAKLARAEDAEAAERAIVEAEACGELLAPEAARGREAVARWRQAAAAEAKLTRALRDGVGSAQLARVIKEGAAAGVKVRWWGLPATGCVDWAGAGTRHGLGEAFSLPLGGLVRARQAGARLARRGSLPRASDPLPTPASPPASLPGG